MVLFIIGYGVLKKIDVYDTFIDGVKESFGMITNLFPTFIAMILAINLFIDSGKNSNKDKDKDNPLL